MIERMLDHWQVNDEDRSAILLIACKNRHVASGFIRIYARLKSLFPRNQQLCYAWMARTNAGFGGARPLDVILSKGERGVEEVIKYLSAY